MYHIDTWTLSEGSLCSRCLFKHDVPRMDRYFSALISRSAVDIGALLELGSIAPGLRAGAEERYRHVYELYIYIQICTCIYTYTHASANIHVCTHRHNVYMFFTYRDKHACIHLLLAHERREHF